MVNKSAVFERRRSGNQKLTDSRALGGSNKNQTPSEKMDEVEVQYPLALAHACILANRGNEGWKMRFLFISGTLSEPDQGKKLWFLGDGRKARVIPPTSFTSTYTLHFYRTRTSSVLISLHIGFSRNQTTRPGQHECEL